MDKIDAPLRTLIAAVYWKPATCQGKVPLHEYILKEKQPELYDRLAALIKTDGYDGYFFKVKFRYLDIDDYKYWAYDILINREKKTNMMREKI